MPQDDPGSRISPSVGLSVFGLLSGLSALSFLAWYLSPDRTDLDAAAPVQATDSAVLADLSERLQDATATRDALRRELDAQTRERADLVGELDRLKQQREKNSAPNPTDAPPPPVEAVIPLQKRIAELEQRLAEEKVGSARTRADLQGEIERLKAESENVRRQADSDAKEWLAEKGRLTASVEALSGQVDTLESRPAEVEIAVLRRQIVNLEQKMDVLGNQRNELARTLRAIRERDAAN